MPNNKEQSQELKKWIADVKAQSIVGTNPQIGGGILGGGIRPNPNPGTITALPPFSAATYTFTVDSIEILNTRSAHLDTNHVSVSAAVGNNPASTALKELGDQNNGHFPVGLSVGQLSVPDPTIGITFNYLVLNSGHQNHAQINKTLTDLGNTLASKGAAAATVAVGTAIGLSTGSVILPGIGTALGALAGWLVSEVAGILAANCDGPVAAEEISFKGLDLWNKTAVSKSYSHVTYHPGIDSPPGCGSNSKYNVFWTIRRN